MSSPTHPPSHPPTHPPTQPPTHPATRPPAVNDQRHIFPLPEVVDELDHIDDGIGRVRLPVVRPGVVVILTNALLLLATEDTCSYDRTCASS